MTHVEAEAAALRRMAYRRLPSVAIARQRVKIKRRLRRAGVNPAHDIPTWGLIGLMQLPGVRAKLSANP